MIKKKIGESRSKSRISIHKLSLYLASKNELCDPGTEVNVLANMWIESTSFVPLRKHGYKKYFFRNVRVDIDDRRFVLADGRVLPAINTEEMIDNVVKILQGAR